MFTLTIFPHLLLAVCVQVCVQVTLQMDTKDQSPDIILLQNIRKQMWEDRDQIAALVQEELYLDSIPSDNELETETFSCASCLAFIGAVRSALALGLEFEEVAPIAVQVCYNVTPLLDYNGEIMCPGLIDVQGPHVYYVLNVTTETPRELCEFYKECDSQNVHDETPLPVVNRERSLAADTPTTQSHRKFNKADMLKVVHLTDVHVDMEYDIGTPTTCNLPLCCRDVWDGQGIAGEWGNYQCNMPVRTLEVILQHMVDQQPDVIIYTGDTPCHAIWEETVDVQLTQQQVLTDLLRSYFSNISSHVAIGNHDVYPTNVYFADRSDIQEMHTRLIEMWGDLARFEEQQRETFQNSAYYSVGVVPGLRVISYNTNYGTNGNSYGPLLENSTQWRDMVQFMEDAFDESRERGEKVLVLGHHLLAGGNFDFYIDAINDIMNRNGDLMVMQFYGHSHTDKFQMSVDANFTTTSVWISAGTGGTRTSKNPSYKIFYLDPDTFQPLDADNFYINITAAVDGETPRVELMYNYLEEYGMADLTPASFQDFVDRMVYDAELFERYWYNRDTRAGDPDECDEQCRYDEICDLRGADPQRNQECRDMMPFP